MVIGAGRARAADSRWNDVTRIAGELSDHDWKVDREKFDQLLADCFATVAAEPGSAYYRYWSAVYRWRVARNSFEPGDAQLAAAARTVVDELNVARTLCPTFGPIYSML